MSRFCMRNEARGAHRGREITVISFCRTVSSVRYIRTRDYTRDCKAGLPLLASKTLLLIPLLVRLSSQIS